MIFARVQEVAAELLASGFTVLEQHEGRGRDGLDAEIVIDPNITIQVAFGTGEPRYGVSIEQSATSRRRRTSRVRHLGYYDAFDRLCSALRRCLDGSGSG